MTETVRSGGLEAPLTEWETMALQELLWRLLAGQAARCTMGESSSLPENAARELLASLVYTLGLENAPAVRLRRFLTVDPARELAFRQSVLAEKCRRSEALWRQVCLELPQLENRALTDTLRSIGGAWRKYDSRYFTCEFPGDIDYPLCFPIPETLRGVDYVAAYLTALRLENSFLSRFRPERMIRVLRSAYRDYRELLVNLFEPMAANALACALLEEDPLTLEITEDGREKLQAVLSKAPDLEKALAAGAERLCGMLNVEDSHMRALLLRTAKAMTARTRAALAAGDLSGVFVPLAPEA